jgi:hypothetical protein
MRFLEVLIYMMILQEIYERSNFFDFVCFIHESRDCNREAHILAKHPCNLEPACLAGFPSYNLGCKHLIK